jgi:energy-coupling factor transport system substrate-specific component
VRTNLVILIALCAALNLVVGTIVYLFKLPIYLDMIGTILCALAIQSSRRVAFIASAAAALISFLLGGLVNPYLPWFSGTGVAVAAVVAFVGGPQAARFRTDSMRKPIFWVRVAGLGILTGLVAAVVSAPVVVFLFGGVTGSGSAALVAFFLKTGHQLMRSALLSGLTAEPIDKTAQILLAVLLLRATPASFLRRFAVAGSPDRSTA